MHRATGCSVCATYRMRLRLFAWVCVVFKTVHVEPECRGGAEICRVSPALPQIDAKPEVPSWMCFVAGVMAARVIIEVCRGFVVVSKGGQKKERRRGVKWCGLVIRMLNCEFEVVWVRIENSESIEMNWGFALVGQRMRNFEVFLVGIIVNSVLWGRTATKSKVISGFCIFMQKFANFQSFQIWSMFPFPDVLIWSLKWCKI